jgi:hypothetical protein
LLVEYHRIISKKYHRIIISLGKHHRRASRVDAFASGPKAHTRGLSLTDKFS